MEEFAELAIKHALKLGAKYAEARLENTSGTSFALNNGILQGSSFGESTGLGIRILANNTISCASTNIISAESIKNAVKRALDFAENNTRKTNLKFAEAPAVKFKHELKQRKNILDIEPDEKIAFLKQLDSSLLKCKVVPSRNFGLSDGIIKNLFVNSEGTKIETIKPMVNLFYVFTVQENANTMQRMWQYGATKGWEIIDKWNLQQILPEEAKAISKTLKFGVKAPSEKVDVVVGPQVSGIIAHESCGHPFEADRIFGREAAQAGESWINLAMLGNKLGSEAVNLVDDPTIENSYGFYTYDDEGVKAKRKYLIKSGKISEFLHNRESAGAMGIKSNGSARASEYDKEPLVRMSNTFFEPGKQSEQELIESIKKGVYFKSFMEWNIDDKRYNNRYVSSEAYLIDNGKLTKPVKSAVFEITTPALYAAIDAVANNFELHAATCGKGEPMQGMPVTHGGGSLRLRGIKLK